MMGLRKFSSPREEALEIAYTARKNLLDGKSDVESLLRSCLVVSTNLNKIQEEKWIEYELFGYPESSKVPDYRLIPCEYTEGGFTIEVRRKFRLDSSIHNIIPFIKANQPAMVKYKGNIEAEFDRLSLRLLIPNIEDKCLSFLNDIIRELQFGGIVEYLMEEIRNHADEKLVKLDEKISQETNSLYTNLSSKSPADWTKVAHSCRRILKFLADKIFPPTNEIYIMRDGRRFEVKENQVINRLCAFIDQKASGEERKIVIAETKYLEEYIRQVVDISQKGEHEKDVEEYDAHIIAIHTYLIVSEILKLLP